MPESVYKLVFNDPQTTKLAKNDIDLTLYTRHLVDLIGKCTFYMLSKVMKQPIKVEVMRNSFLTTTSQCQTQVRISLPPE